MFGEIEQQLDGRAAESDAARPDRLGLCPVGGDLAAEVRGCDPVAARRHRGREANHRHIASSDMSVQSANPSQTNDEDISSPEPQAKGGEP